MGSASGSMVCRARAHNHASIVRRQSRLRTIDGRMVRWMTMTASTICAVITRAVGGCLTCFRPGRRRGKTRAQVRGVDHGHWPGRRHVGSGAREQARPSSRPHSGAPARSACGGLPAGRTPPRRAGRRTRPRCARGHPAWHQHGQQELRMSPRGLLRAGCQIETAPAALPS
jgi:hypothetical protein